MATDPTTRVASGEGEITVNGVSWCQTELTITLEKGQQPVTSACDWDEVEKVVWPTDKTTSKRYNIQAGFDLDTEKDPIPTFSQDAENNDTLTVVARLYSGYTIAGTFTCSEGPTFTGQGADNLWRVTIGLKSQGKPTVQGA
jgi:hypothetical protein